MLWIAAYSVTLLPDRKERDEQMDGHDLNKLIEGVWELLQHLAMRDRIEEVVSLGEQAVRHFLEDLEHDRGIAIATLQEPEFRAQTFLMASSRLM